MSQVLCYNACEQGAVRQLLESFGLSLHHVPEGQDIPGSFWGDEEAGLIKSTIYIRPDTPVHSILHEACHYVCMDQHRKDKLHTNAGGTHAEENAVCYLQILLADCLPDMGRARMCTDMDSWGYSFRLGSAKTWFEQDAEDARQWLQSKGLLDMADRFTHAHTAALQ